MVGGLGADFGEDVLEVGEGVVAMKFAAGDEAIEDGGALGPGFTAGKEVVFSVMQSFA